MTRFLEKYHVPIKREDYEVDELLFGKLARR